MEIIRPLANGASYSHPDYIFKKFIDPPGDKLRAGRRYLNNVSPLKADIGELRTTDFAQIRAEGVQLRAELAQLRSDVTYIGVAVGARRAEGSG